MAEVKSKLPKQKAAYQKSISRILKKSDSAPKSPLNRKKETPLWEILAFILPFFFLGFGFYSIKMYPFGDRQFLVTDLWHQYYPFFQLIHEKLQGMESLLYSWRTGLGTNFLALMAYYAASPLNLLSVFVPQEWLREAMTVILMLKFCFAGWFMAKFLRYTFNRNDISITMFGVMFAMCSYMMGYYWNTIWIDTVALLPLVMLGLVMLVREGKYRVYVIALALALLSNYYIGYFICIFTVFAFFFLCLYENTGIKKFFGRFALITVSSLAGAALSSWILLPAYNALKLTHSADNTFPKSPSYYEGWREILSNMLAFTEPTSKEGLPNLYCGFLPVLLLGVFLFSKKVRIREKVTAVLMMAFLIVSCNMNILNFIWHGFHFTNMLPYRFSFLFSFVVLVAAFRAYQILLEEKLKVFHWGAMLLAGVLICITAYGSKQEDNKTYLIITGVLAGLFLIGIIVTSIFKSEKFQKVFGWGMVGISVIAGGAVLCMHFMMPPETTSEEDIYKFILSSALLGAVYLTAVFCRSFASKNTVQFLIAAILIFEMGTQGVNGVKAVGTSDRKSYPSNKVAIDELVDYAESREGDDFFRTELTYWYTLNDPSLYYYNGVSQFSSMANVKMTTFMRLLGLPASEAGNRYYYANTSPFTNMMLGIRYIIAKDGYNADTLTQRLVSQSGSVTLYENLYDLPIGFMVEENVGRYNPGISANAFDNQNNLFRRVTGVNKNLFTPVDIIHVGHKGYLVTRSAYGTYSYTRDADATSDSFLKYNYSAPVDAMYYAYVKVPDSKKLEVFSNNVPLHTYNADRQPFITPANYCTAGEMLTLRCKLEETAKSGSANVFVYYLNPDILQAGYDALADEVLNVTSHDDTRIEGTVNVKKEGYLYLSIPYEEGWSVYVDGEEREMVCLMDAMCGVRLEPGEHSVTLKYSPKGFVPGLILSIGTLGLLVILWTMEKKGIRIFPKKAKPETNPSGADAEEAEGTEATAKSEETDAAAETAPEETEAAPDEDMTETEKEIPEPINESENA